VDSLRRLGATGDPVVDAREIETQYGYAWLLSDAEAARYGRKFLPVGTRSRRPSARSP